MSKKLSKNHRVVHFKGDFKRRIGATVNVIEIEPANEIDSSRNQKRVPTNREILDDFLESTSIHGLQYFGRTDVKVGVFGKTLWTLTMLLGFACSTVMVIQFLNRYNENPTNTFIKAFNNPIFEAPFPAVTLCPFSPIPQERQQRILDGITIPANMSTEAVLNLLNGFSIDVAKNYPFYRGVHISHEALDVSCTIHVAGKTALLTYIENSLCRELRLEAEAQNCGLHGCAQYRYGHLITFPYSMQSYEENDLAELLKANHWSLADFLKILEPCEDILDSCWWSSERIDCGKSIVLSHSSYGLCCSFNYLLEEFVGRDKNQPTPKPIRSVDYGRRSGLKLLINKRILNSNSDEYESSQSSMSISNSDGIAVLIHHSLDFPGLNTNSYILQKNNELQINVSPTISSAPEDLYHRNREGKVASICVQNSEALEYFPVYTYSNCYANCRVKAMIRICGCLPFIYEHLAKYYNITPCELEGLMCIQKNTKQISIIRDVQTPNLTCTCKTPCEQVVYNGFPNSIDLMYPQTATSYKNVTSDDAILRVFMHSQVFVKMETMSAADEVYLLASIGGIFSLFLGSSFLSVVEILYFVKLFFHAVYQRRKNGSTPKKLKRRSYGDYDDYEDTRRNIY